MFGHLFSKQFGLKVYGERVFLRTALRTDYLAWSTLRHESRAFLQPWEPSWSEDELSRAAFTARRRQARANAASGTGYVFLIFDRQTSSLVGGITLGGIRYGVSRSGQIGYWMGEKFAGKGLMQDALKALIGFGFETLKLHRLEAACIASNKRSIRVLEKCGFSYEGLLKSYLKINDEWQDHLLFARVSGVTV